ncbi:lysis system i-spanin subunit Rz [Pseudomonas asplenii]|uniref:Bacteriophage Rz lysis protein n=1 Tax=Pseudomonas asplenii TaxID=53407 RepID=A0A1H6NWQ9_9PSED|nr:lysis system i-spanin subunit Rz [Pseudomonas fuscovaginae]SEI17291.1 Bacteriophage Rz lysis protein [Pseudomonas fuscovaginae]
MIPAGWRAAGFALGLLLLVALGAVGAWVAQDWRYGKQLAEQAGLHQQDLADISKAAAAQQRAEQEKRMDLEQRISASDKSHHQELTNVQNDQARLRDRLATADLRLSVLVAQGATAGGANVQTTTTAGSVVHGTARAWIDPAAAERIVGITDDGDRALIALEACQAYAKEVSLSK